MECRRLQSWKNFRSLAYQSTVKLAQRLHNQHTLAAPKLVINEHSLEVKGLDNFFVECT